VWRRTDGDGRQHEREATLGSPSIRQEAVPSTALGVEPVGSSPAMGLGGHSRPRPGDGEGAADEAPSQGSPWGKGQNLRHANGPHQSTCPPSRGLNNSPLAKYAQAPRDRRFECRRSNLRSLRSPEHLARAILSAVGPTVRRVSHSQNVESAIVVERLRPRTAYQDRDTRASRGCDIERIQPLTVTFSGQVRHR